MKLSEIVRKLGLKVVGETDLESKDITGVYVSDMVSDIIANAKAGNLLVTVQIHNNVIAAANLVDIAGIVVTQGKQPAPDVVKMADKASIPILSTGMNGWQVMTQLYEAGVR
jgi:predicted transcriptional regulator